MTPNFEQEAEKLLTFAEHCGDHEVVRKEIAFFLETACEKGFEACREAAIDVIEDHWAVVEGNSEMMEKIRALTPEGKR